MKKSGILCLAATLLLATACRKEQQSITESEAADIVSASVSHDYGGMSSEIREITQRLVFPVHKTGDTPAETQAFWLCDTTITDTIQNSGSGLNITWSYYFDFANTYACDSASHLQSIHTVTHKNGHYKGPHLSSTYKANADWTVTGLAPGQAHITYNGTLHREGSHSFTDKKGNTRSVSGVIDVTLNNVVVSRFLGMTQSGTASITLSGTNTQGNPYNYTGSIQFLGNHQALLTINGNTYNIKVW